MGCGGSKPEEKTDESSQKKKQNRAKSRTGKTHKPGTTPKRSPAVQKKPAANDDRRIGDTIHNRKPPKGIKRGGTQSSIKSESVPPMASYSEPVPYEPENLSLTGNWEIEKGVDDDTLITDNAYPPPRPCKVHIDKLNYTAVDFEIMKNIDMKMAAGTFEDVTSRLTSQFSPDIMKVRALTTWMSSQKIRTRTYGPDAKPGTVMCYMKQIKELKGTFAGLLTLLCRAINIPCVIIKGIFKDSCHQVGEDDLSSSRCTWNAVHVDSGWQLVHPYLICTPLATQSPKEGWKLIESCTTDSNIRPGFVLNTFFFAPKPSDYIQCCIPDDNQCLWQLLEQKVHFSQFLKAPFLRPAAFSSNMTLKTDKKSVLISEGGKCNIRLKCESEVLNNIEVNYELYSMDQDMTLKEEWGNLVLCGRNEDTWNVQLKFPIDGTFKIALYGLLNDWFFWLGDFKIVCDQPLVEYLAHQVVPEEVGWGPSKVSEAGGLLTASHEGGLIFYKPNEEHVVKFLINEKIKYRHEIENVEIEKEVLHKYCRHIHRKSEIDFVVNLPLSGEFALRIYRVDENGEATNVCNYLFTDADDGRKRENLFQRKARWNLREAAADHDIPTLEAALVKYKAVKLEEDDDYIRARRRLNYLKLKKGLRDGRMRRHEQTLSEAVHEAEMSQFKPALQLSIDTAKDELKGITSLEMSCHPVQEMDQKTIAEIANFANPPGDVHATMMATYLLLGEDYKLLKKWGYIQSLLRRQGKEGIKQRVQRFKHNEAPMPDQHTIQQAQDIHCSVPKEYILSASLSAATFYNWVSGVLGYLNNYSQNALDADDTFGTDMSQNATLADDTLIEGYNKQEINLSQDEGFLDIEGFETSTRAGTQMQ